MAVRARTIAAPGRTKSRPAASPSLHAMQSPSRVGRELHGLGAGQQHAEVQGVEECRLVQPLLFVDQNAVHQRDLAGWPSEREDADARERRDGFAKAGRIRVGGAGFCECRHAGRVSECGWDRGSMPEPRELCALLPRAAPKDWSEPVLRSTRRPPRLRRRLSARPSAPSRRRGPRSDGCARG